VTNTFATLGGCPEPERRRRRAGMPDDMPRPSPSTRPRFFSAVGFERGAVASFIRACNRVCSLTRKKRTRVFVRQRCRNFAATQKHKKVP